VALIREQFFLLKLAEECSEVAKRAIKQIQFGKDEAQNAIVKLNPDDTDARPTNAQRLREEINDLLVLVRSWKAWEKFQPSSRKICLAFTRLSMLNWPSICSTPKT